MANVTWTIENTFGVNAGILSVDEDSMFSCPRMTDTSESKRAGDMIVGDSFHLGNSRAITYVITTIDA